MDAFYNYNNYILFLYPEQSSYFIFIIIFTFFCFLKNIFSLDTIKYIYFHSNVIFKNIMSRKLPLTRVTSDHENFTIYFTLLSVFLALNIQKIKSIALVILINSYYQVLFV